MSIAVPAAAQRGTEGREWPHYAGDSGSTKYSPLEQIDGDNFAQLEVAWRWESADALLEDVTTMRPGPFRSTPLMVNGVLYTPTGMSQVAALDPGSGETLWLFDPRDYERDDVRKVGLVQVRGLEYWTDGDEERIVLATRARRLISIDAKTGKLDLTFGIATSSTSPPSCAPQRSRSSTTTSSARSSRRRSSTARTASSPTSRLRVPAAGPTGPAPRTTRRPTSSMCRR